MTTPRQAEDGLSTSGRLLPMGTLRSCVIVSVGLLSVGLVLPVLLEPTPRSNSRRVLNGVAFESSDGAPAWWATVLLLLVAILAFLVGRRCLEAGFRRYALRWRVLAAVFVWTSFDHATQVHVEVSRLVSELTGLPGGVQPLTILLGGVAAWAWLPLLVHAPTGWRTTAVLALLLLLGGGWGVDVVRELLGGVPAVWTGALEAGLTWTGLLLLVGLLDGAPVPGAGEKPSDRAAPRRG